MNAEQTRLEDRSHPWKKWGPYLTERQWGTVREDYSAIGNAWDSFSHEHARSRTYRWGEDGIAGVSDDLQYLCLSVALWNGRDPILKERLFGLTGSQGNHGEDVKECYYYLDNTPTHSYMKMLYKYPQRSFPYEVLITENRRRTRQDAEYELIDTGVFEDDRYFDVFTEYAKIGPEDLLMRVTVWNRGPEEATIHVLPHVWFRNTWSWGLTDWKPSLRQFSDETITLTHPVLGARWVYFEGGPDLLFCENETNVRRLYGVERPGYFKDGIGDRVIHGDHTAVNPALCGTKAAAHYRFTLASGESREVWMRFCDAKTAGPFREFKQIFSRRIQEANAFYRARQKNLPNDDARLVQRQAFAGMLWSKQFYYFDIPQWLTGDPGQPSPPPERKKGRNNEWMHLNNAEILSMPDKWEYPWYAAWDLAFHCVPLALIDPDFAKEQLILLTREWYMHPNGQLPAYEWSFGDVNPPVHAWAAWRVYEIDRKRRGGKGDMDFLERILHKLLLNFTWWVNRKDAENHNIFQGGFLGLDNIGVFDRSAVLPTGGHVEQSDATSWMAMYSLNLMRIALEVATVNHVYEDLATKFFEHFLYIAGAMANVGGEGINLWDEDDEFFYDVLHLPDGAHVPLKVRSMVGLIPLFAVEVLEPALLDALPEFKLRLEWFLHYRPDLAGLVSRWHEPGAGERRLLSLLRGRRMKRLLKRMLDETEFLSPYGIRALSRYHHDHPYTFHADGQTFSVAYRPAESDSGLFGGNSNWRGPIWFPVNYLIVASLRKFYAYYGDDFKIECPTGSGRHVTIRETADELAARLSRLFLRNSDGERPVFGVCEKHQADLHFRDYVLFYEYFHGDDGRGAGASHQTGWTGLAASLLAEE
ncbi:MAG: glucosidase [candidate division Zixibacteria bacterium]|nr:glucosidase [candidate division Zixibacteria bacterium]